MAESAAREAQVCLVIGTRGEVYPAAGLVFRAHEAGASIIVVDPNPTAFDDIANYRLSGHAGEVIPALLEAREVEQEAR